MPARRLILALAVALMAGIVALIASLAQEPPPLQVQRLPDGSILRLEAVTVGLRHRFVGGSRWRRLLDQWEIRLRGTTPAYVAPTRHKVVFWTSRPAGAWLGASGRVVFFDEHGCEFGGFGYLPQFQSPGPRSVEGWPATVTPRRARRIGVRFLDVRDPARPVRVAEFTVPNPAFGPTPDWEPETLPATRREGELAFTLTAFKTGLAGPGQPLRPAKGGGRGWTRATFRVLEAGRPTLAWSPVLLTVSDAAGHEMWLGRKTGYRAEEQTHVALEHGLCIREPAWKLRVEFARTGDFPAGDLWVVRGVPIIRRGALPRIGVSTRRHGAQVELFGIAAPGVNAAELGVIPRARPLVALRVSPLSSAVRLTLLKVTDERGRAVEWVPYEAGSDAWSRKYGFSLKAGDETRKVDLTLALSRSRTVEFMVRPARR